MCLNFIGKNKEKSNRKNAWRQKIKMPRGKYKIKFRRSIKELKEFLKENDIRLLNLSEYLRKRNDKKIEKGIISKCQK